ncbi:MAG: hypothetical protein DMG73_19820 [Acidobacteria bacterium]|nr:MAG: hypothetical protein DMG73_19820 [Acidobacteriota bacterium]
MPYRSIKQVGATTAARASVKPESGTLALLGTGLIGLATLVRRHFSN